MTGRASPAKAAVGDKPVFAYIDSLPQPQRGIAEAIDALAAGTLPGLQRSVKWGMAYYGVGDGWCFSCGGSVTHQRFRRTSDDRWRRIAQRRDREGLDVRHRDDIAQIAHECAVATGLLPEAEGSLHLCNAVAGRDTQEITKQAGLRLARPAPTQRLIDLLDFAEDVRRGVSSEELNVDVSSST